MLITSPKNDEEVFNIEVSDNYRDESDLKIPLGSQINDDVDDISIYDTPFIK